MSMPTGRVEQDGDRHTLVITRTFDAPIDDVWAAVTEPERLERWIGTWTGDPGTGHVTFAMTAEGQTEGDDMEIRECDPPRRLALTSRVGEERWLLEVDLVEADGVTTVTFRQPGIDPAVVENVGPGWEYYLDRWGTAVTGGDVGVHDFERDYYPAMKAHYSGRTAGPTA